MYQYPQSVPEGQRPPQENLSSYYQQRAAEQQRFGPPPGAQQQAQQQQQQQQPSAVASAPGQPTPQANPQHGQAIPQPRQASQVGQQQAPQGTQSPYYNQQQYSYYYQMPVPAEQGQTQPSGDRYQAAGLYGYGSGYPSAPSAPATRPPYPYPYGSDAMMMMYPPQQQPQPQQSPHIAAQRGVYATAPGQIRGQQQVSAPGQPQPLAPVPMPRTAPGTPGQMHRATVSTHLSAIPPTMPVTDPTGQTAPPGIKPRVTTTLWEDEGTTCFQVEARGFCVARREDNDMINGTKLLNVAGMTRGRRDGLLKGERNRHVVKAGAMHLKGVWIPYERALDFANKERIVDLLYPLFVTDIKSVLYHPSNPDMRHDGSATSQQTPSSQPLGQPAPMQTAPQAQPDSSASQAPQTAADGQSLPQLPAMNAVPHMQPGTALPAPYTLAMPPMQPGQQQPTLAPAGTPQQPKPDLDDHDVKPLVHGQPGPAQFHGVNYSYPQDGQAPQQQDGQQYYGGDRGMPFGDRSMSYGHGG